MGRKPWEGPWVATFKDGPYKGHTRWWAVGPIWKEIVLAPSPHDHHRFFICGGDGIPPAPEVTEPWPHQTAYRLAHTRKAKFAGEDTMIADYQRAPEAAR